MMHFRLGIFVFAFKIPHRGFIYLESKQDAVWFFFFFLFITWMEKKKKNYFPKLQYLFVGPSNEKQFERRGLTVKNSGLRIGKKKRKRKRKAWHSYKTKTATFSLPVDKIEGVSLRHLLLRSSQELLSVNPEPEKLRRKC